MPTTSSIYPTLRCCSKVAEPTLPDMRLFDVKWYPYATAGDEQIFATCGVQSHVYVCRVKEDSEPPFEVLRWWQHDDPDTAFNSLVWTKDPVSGNPLVCVAGHHPHYVLILDVMTNKIVRTLQGHGKAINDLAVSPISTNLIASAAADHTIRLWNLDPLFKDQPCVAILAGGGHRQSILSINFHPNGKWLLSGALDSAVALWAIPSLKELAQRPENGEPLNIFYPMFFSNEVHAGYVDNVQFYGDLIISRASQDQTVQTNANAILIWQIEDFDPDGDSPGESLVPEPGLGTLSAFPHPAQSRGFRRIITLDTPHTDRFYLRFGLLNKQGMRPILAMGNQQSRFSFWDLQRLEEGWDPTIEGKDGKLRRGASNKGASKAKGKAKLPTASVSTSSVRAESSERFNDAGNGSVTPSNESVATATGTRKYELGDPFKHIKPHAKVMPPTKLSEKWHFQTQQMEWSPDGTWLAAACDHAIICLFHRDASVVNNVR